MVAAFHTGLGFYDASTVQECQFIPTYGWKARLSAAVQRHTVALIAKDGVQPGCGTPPRGGELGRLEQGFMVYDAAFRPDGGRLATADFDGLIWIWGIP